MTTCIKCGPPIPDGELFCESVRAERRACRSRGPQLRPVGRMQTPVQTASRGRAESRRSLPHPPHRQKQIRADGKAGDRGAGAFMLCRRRSLLRLCRASEEDAALLQS